MIVLFILGVFLSAIQGMLGILPNVPATPQGIIDGGQWTIDQVTAVISVLNMLFTPGLVAAVMIVIIATFNFTWIYHATMWIIKKIPMLNVK